MVCTKCGAQLPENAKFCSACGAPAELPAEPEFVSGNPDPFAPTQNQELDCTNVPTNPPSPTNVLVFGILGLSFACSFWLSILGIIFSAIAKGKANAYATSGAAYSTQVKVGRNLAKAGFIVGIVLSAILSFYLVIVVIGLGLSSLL